MSDITETIAAARDHARENNLDVIEGGENVLLLDFDTISAAMVYDSMRKKLDELFHIVEEQWWQSKSKSQHHHGRVYLKEKLTATERVALQAALGSDGWREMFAVRRLKLGVEEPSLLFRPQDAVIYTSWQGIAKVLKKLPSAFDGLEPVNVF